MVPSLLMLAACGVRLPDPVVLSVEPDRGWNGEETVISIEGSSFFPEVQIDLNRRDLADLDRGFTAWLERDGTEFPLNGVGLVDYQHLGALVRPGLAPGPYDLVVQGPSGREGRLDGAFTVSDTRADRLSLTAPQLDWTVNDTALLSLQVVDPLDAPVFLDLEVEVRVRGLSAPADASFGAALANQVTSPDGLVISGFLGPDGRATVPLVVRTPDTVEVTAAVVAPANGIRTAQLQLLWESGTAVGVRFTLPSSPLAVAAGEAFLAEVAAVDAFGNVVPGPPNALVVATSCGDFLTSVDLSQGSATVQVVPEEASGSAGCPEQRLVVLSVLPGQSEAFTVSAGPTAGFDVSTNGGPLVAGGVVEAFVGPRDAFGNLTSWTDPLVVDDSVGGLVDGQCSGGPGLRFCSGRATVAGPTVRFLVESQGLTGQSAPYVVLAASDIAGFEVEVLGDAVAGEPLDVAVQPIDPFGNPIPAGLLVGAVALTDDLGEAECTATGPRPDDRVGFVCTLLTARPAASLRASSGTLVVGSPTFPVVNGALEVALVSAPAAGIAGEPFDVGIQAFDGWGNPYLVQTVGAVELGEPDGSPVVVPLEPDGTAVVSVVLEQARVTRLEARSGGVLLGTSGAITVGAGPASALSVGPSRPWAWAGTPAEVRVVAVDAYGNRSASTATVLVTPASGQAAPVQLDLVNGAGTATLTWAGGVIAETVTASGGGLAGLSAPFVVARSCGAPGPTIVVDFAGAPTGRACVDPGDTADVVVSFVGSTPGASPIVSRMGSVDGGPAASGGVAFPVTVEHVGRSSLDALVVDTALCGAETSTSIWAGPDDGGAVGALAVTVDSAQIPVGTGSTAIRVQGAVDCTGDPAGGASLGVRSDRGVVLGAVPTGSGLQLALDGAGSGSVVLDAGDVTSGGTATLVFDAPSGGASGTATVAVQGDDRPPRVWSQSPSGATVDPVDALVLVFDEPLLPSTVQPGSFTLTGPDDVAVVGATLLDPARVEVLPESPVDASAGTWSLAASDALRDLAGNRLEPWVGVFGAVGAPVDGVVCEVSPSRFRPDGDPGVGEEADAVELTLQSASAPALWVISVRDAEGTLRVRERVPALAATDVWSWDGRDVSERVVPDGSYAVSAEADDGFGNRGTGCAALVVVDNVLEGP